MLERQAVEDNFAMSSSQPKLRGRIVSKRPPQRSSRWTLWEGGLLDGRVGRGTERGRASGEMKLTEDLGRERQDQGKGRIRGEGSLRI